MTSKIFWGIDLVEFGTDANAPTLENRNPGVGATDQLDDVNVYLEIVDTGDSGLNLSTVLVEMNVDGAGYQNAYVGSTDTFPSPYDGVASARGAVANGISLTMDPNPDFGQNRVVQVRVTASDNAGNTLGPVVYQFQTGIPPYVSLRDPFAGETNVDPDKDITVRIRDDGSGVDQDETLVRVDLGSGFQDAYDHDGGGFQAPFTGTYSEIVAGLEYQVVIVHPTITEGETVQVNVQGADNSGFVLNDTEQFTARNQPPFLSNLSPASGATGVHPNDDIRIDLRDLDSGVVLSLTTIYLNVDGGGWQTAYDGSTDTFASPYNGPNSQRSVLTDGHRFVIDDDGMVFDQGQTIQIRVVSEDAVGNTLDTTYQYTTFLGVDQTPVLYTRPIGDVINLFWQLPPPDEMLQELFQLRRSTQTPPTTPSEGELVYEGVDREFTDTDVEYGVTYHYTIFVIQSFASGIPQYLPYEEPASASAKIREIFVSVVTESEYVPVRGDFGDKTIQPVANSQTVGVWGRLDTTRQTSEIMRVPPSVRVKSPVNGTVRDLGTDYIDIETRDTEIVIRLSDLIPMTSLLSRGDELQAGQVIGQTSTTNMRLEIYKLPSGTFGKRTVRPKYFWATIEDRDAS